MHATAAQLLGSPRCRGPMGGELLLRPRLPPGPFAAGSRGSGLGVSENLRVRAQPRPYGPGELGWQVWRAFALEDRVLMSTARMVLPASGVARTRRLGCGREMT